MSKLVEEWRPVVGYEGLYEVSDWGRVKSLDRVVDQYNHFAKRVCKRRVKGRIMKKTINCQGYEVVTLTDPNHIQKEGKVHILVAKAFLPNPHNKKEVGHTKTLDNGLEDKTANEAWNIQWMTREENANYGTLPQRLSERMIGDKNPMKRKEVAAKVAEKQREIGKRRYEENQELLEAFFNSDKHVDKIKKPINQYTLDEELMKYWDSAADVERELGIFASNIRACCKGRINSAGGFKFKYV